MHNMAHPQESVQLPIDEISSPIGAHLEFSESELFPEMLQSSGVASIGSNNNNCYEENSSYNPTDTTTTTTTTTTNNNNDISIVNDGMNNNNNTSDYNGTTTSAAGNINGPVFFDGDDGTHLDINNDISASIDFTNPSSPSFSLPDHHQYFNNDDNIDNNQQLLLFNPAFNNNNQVSFGDDVDFGQPYMADQQHQQQQYNPEAVAGTLSGLMMPPPVSVPPYNNIYMPSSYGLSAPFSFDGFTNGLFMGNEHPHPEMEFQGDNIGGVFHPDSSMARVFSCSTGDLQPLSSESQQHMLHGSPNTTPASEASSLEDPNFTVPKLSAEERKMKIHRYLKKRNQRNFSKKIKYACRKTLADSRPRVRGRFAKNDELAEIARASNGNNRDDDTDDDFRFFSNPMADRQQGSKAVKEEDDLEASDIFAHISGVNSFKCNYPIQSWI